MADSGIQDDERFMREALAEGARGLGATSPNPPVGALVVRGGNILGRGWHRRAGEPHAEILAIREAQERGGPDAARGATLYVTLEPCSTAGRTPPCTEAVLAAGLSRVVVGTLDPNPRHAGAGLTLLEREGVAVGSGVCEEEARHLVRFFAKHVVTGLPWVIAKTAATLDGRTGTARPGERWITGEAAREDVQRLRRQCDAILVGGETFRADNPALTLRGVHAEGRPQPLRVILTSREDLPAGHRLFTDEHADRTRLHRGISLAESLQMLGDEGVCSVLLESGGRLLCHGLEEGLVDELVLYLAPVLGGGGARLVPREGYLARLESAELLRVGEDFRISGRVRPGG